MEELISNIVKKLALSRPTTDDSRRLENTLIIEYNNILDDVVVGLTGKANENQKNESLDMNLDTVGFHFSLPAVGHGNPASEAFITAVVIETGEQDNIGDGIDLNNAELNNALKNYLDPNNPMFNKVDYRGLCLVGFDSDKYPTEPNSKEIEDLKTEISEVYRNRKSHIRSRVKEEKIDSFEIELFLVPFPSVEEFRIAFRKEIGVPNE